jgi:hypothetical protein
MDPDAAPTIAAFSADGRRLLTVENGVASLVQSDSVSGTIRAISMFTAARILKVPFTSQYKTG